MRCRLPHVIQDPATTAAKGMPPVEAFYAEREPFFLDGPVTRRLAVLDLDETSGRLLPGVPFLPAAAPDGESGFELAQPEDLASRAFQAVSVFATVLKTLYLFEESDTLGREVRWAFDAPQLLIVPRAGEWANACYERESHSLQFFFFPSRLERKGGSTVYTCLSQDIVAHETAHAILDGIAPDLYNAITPQSLALHEALADIAALTMCLRSRELVKTVLEQNGGSIGDASAFSWLAEEFGAARDASGRSGYLRSLANDKTLDAGDDSVDERGRPNSVARADAHGLSQVLSGALFRVLVASHEEIKARLVAETGRSEFSVSGRALFEAGERLKRLALRGLDYLPPGEVSFADYARAVLAADQASHPASGRERRRLVAELVRRHVATAPAELEVATDFEHPALAAADLAALVASDWAAYDFANRQRRFLGIPEGVHFRVRPRLDVGKRYYRSGGPAEVRELIFKVSWDREEANHGRPGLPARRQVTVGTTLAVDWESRRARALLISHAAADRGSESTAQLADRDLLLTRLLDRGMLDLDGEIGVAAVRAESSGALMRLRASARLLHVAPEGSGAGAVPARRGEPAARALRPPPGVDAGAFFNLIERRRRAGRAAGDATSAPPG